MPDRPMPSVSVVALSWRHSRVRAGLLGGAAATVAVAIATAILVAAVLARGVATAGVPAPPGIDADELDARIGAGVAALTAAAPALGLLIALVAGTAVAQLARLLAVQREHETATLRARGRSSRQAWAADAVEAALIALAGLVVGVPVALAAAPLVGAGAGDALALWPVAPAVAIVLALIFLVALRLSARADAATRGVRATAAVSVLAVLAGAGLVAWQLPSARPGAGDPIVAVAPAVVLAAAALVSLAVCGALTALIARLAGRRPGLTPSFPARQVARRLTVTAVAVLLVAAASAQIAFAAVYAQTWQSAATTSAALRTGADLRVDLPPQSARPAEVADAAAVPDITRARPALIAQTEIGQTDAELVATGSVPSDPADPAAPAAPAATGLRAAPLDLGADATGIRVALSLAAPAGALPVLAEVRLGLVLLDATGAAVTVTAQAPVAATGTDTTGTAVMTTDTPLPRGAAPWRLLAVTAELVPGVVSRAVDVSLVSVDAGGGAALPVSGAAALGGADGDAAVLWLGVPDTAASDPAPVGGQISRALAARLGIGVGDVFEFRYEGTGRRGAVIVTGVVEAVPGASQPLAVATALDALLASQLQRDTTIVPATSVWADGPAGAAPALSEALGDRPVATGTPGVTAQVVGALVPAWGVATAGAVLLTLIAAIAIVQTLALARRRDLGVLRALGVTARRQARMRVAELTSLFGAALVVGAAAGLAAAVVVVPALVVAVTPGILPDTATPVVDAATLLIALVALALALAVVAVAAGAAVRRGAAAATVGEEAR
ncbi:hypothetical protein N3K63_09690 [Microbacterium sp. W1N]|uniref:FtsX-like permease family protein n=1 Tax=Microbacterium festucae TaxID=2977531 RepID=UPI0021C0BFF6|nr:FtsX-like permease family protein [Microbacterium festucae]MCT9820553.1 hypothetical protein [Microbacterium festucae]